MHKIKQNEIVDLSLQLYLAGSALKTMRQRHVKEKQMFIKRFQTFRSEAELQLHKLQEYFIYELIRVFDFSDAQQIKYHVKDLIYKAQESAYVQERFRGDYEKHYITIQRLQYELYDAKYQIDQLKAVNFQKEQLITDLQINSERGFRTAGTTMMLSQGANDSYAAGNTTISRTPSQSSFSQSVSPQLQISDYVASVVQSPRNGPKQFRRSHMTTDCLIYVNCDTKQVGDELDHRAIVVRVSEDVNEYKLTRNPTTQCYQDSIALYNGAVDPVLMQLFEKFKVSSRDQYTENYYISLVMPWIADVESSKQLLMKYHAALLEKYNTLTTESNRLASQNTVYKGNICVLQAAFDKASIYVKDEQDQATEATRSYMSRIEELNYLVSDARAHEKVATEALRQSDARKYQLEQSVYALEEQLAQLQKQYSKLYRSDTREAEEARLERKVQNLQELSDIYYKQIVALCNRVKDLEYQNYDLLYYLDGYQSRFRRQLENLNYDEYFAQAEGRIKYYEDKLGFITNQLFEQVQQLDLRNKQYATLDTQNTQQSQVIVQMATENKVLKRRIAELAARVSQLLRDLEERNFAVSQLMYRTYNQLAVKNAQIESITRQGAQQDPAKMRYPPYMPRTAQPVYKDAMNRVISRQPRTESYESSSQPTEPEDAETDYFRERATADTAFTSVKSMIDTLYANATLEHTEMRNSGVQTEQLTYEIWHKNVYCQAQTETAEKGVLTPLYVNENDPTLVRYRKEIEFLEEQVKIYEHAKVMEEAKNQILVKTYEQYQDRIRQLYDLSSMYAEEARSAQLRFYDLLRRYRAYPTVEQLKFEASRDFLKQIHDLKLELAVAHRKIDGQNAEIEEAKHGSEQRYYQFVEQARGAQEQFKMLEWYAVQYTERIDKTAGRAAYQIEKVGAVIPPLLDYIKQLKQLIAILKDRITMGIQNEIYKPGEEPCSRYEAYPASQTHLSDMLGAIKKFEQSALSQFDVGKLISSIRPNRRSTSFAYAQAEDIVRSQNKPPKFRVPYLYDFDYDIVVVNSVSSYEFARSVEPQQQFTRKAYVALHRAQTSAEVTTLCRPILLDEGTQAQFGTTSVATQAEFNEKQFVLTSALYIDAFNQLYEAVYTNLLYTDYIKALNTTVRRYYEQHDEHIKDVKFQFSQRPPRDVDAAIIYQQKVSVKLLQAQLDDYKRRYDALVAYFRDTDGLVNLMLGGRANSVGVARRQKWSLSAGAAYAGALKKYV